VAGGERLICASGALLDAGRAVRFEAEYFGEAVPAFAIRFDGAVHAYLNRCGHLAMELDWREGEFFDADGRNLICSTHGAAYAPADGRCVGGPCSGTPLVRLRVVERGGNVYYLGQDDG
jgi:nitrite reductase/ring-hydroxylating ferredoxin subunit